MDLYIDYRNLKSFLDSRQSDDFADCERMIKRQLHVIYNMEKDFLKSDPILCQWVLKLGEGRGDSEKTDSFSSEKFPLRPIKSNAPTQWNRKQLSSIYLIDDEDSSKLKQRGTVLLGNVGEEISELKKLFCGKDYEYHHLYDLQKSFNSWDQLSKQILPCTDIIINDRYLFKNQVELVDYNLSRMLKVLVANVQNKINIVFYTCYNFLKEFNVLQAKDIIKKAIKNINKIDPNVTFVTSNSNNLIPHDRFIITNYRLIRSGDSFLYFNTEGKRITNGGSLDVDSLANYSTYIYVESLLRKLQDSYKNIKSKGEQYIIGAKKSNFITF